MYLTGLALLLAFPMPSRRDGRGLVDNKRPGLVESQSFRFRSPMGSKRLDNIADYRRHGFDLQVQCANCGHTKRHAAETILALCNQRGWSKQMMMLEPKFRCSQCGSRSVRCGPLERDDRTMTTKTYQ